MTVYVVVGEIEGLYQDEKEIVRVFSSRETAEKFVKDSKLVKPLKYSYGDTSYYRFGYYDMEIESWDVE